MSNLEDLQILQEKKSQVITQIKKKHSENQSRFSQLESLSQDFNEIKQSILKLDKSSEEFKEIQNDQSSLEQQLKKFEQLKAEIIPLNSSNYIEQICEDLEKTYKELELVINESLPVNDPVQKDPAKYENLTEFKNKIDSNNQIISESEEYYAKESIELEKLRKDIETLLKMKRDKEFEIKYLLKREEKVQKEHDEEIENLKILKNSQIKLRESRKEKHPPSFYNFTQVSASREAQDTDPRSLFLLSILLLCLIIFFN